MLKLKIPALVGATAWLMLGALPSTAFAASLLIDTLASLHPQAGQPGPQVYLNPIHVESFRFDVEPEPARVRVVLSYTDWLDDTTPVGAARQSIVTVPGLKFDEASSRVVLEEGVKRTECATVSFAPRLMNAHPTIKYTDRCTVSVKKLQGVTGVSEVYLNAKD